MLSVKQTAKNSSLKCPATYAKKECKQKKPLFFEENNILK